MKLVRAVDFLNSDDTKERVKDYLLQGGAVIFPTDTLYGLGVDIRNNEGVERLFSLKGRERDKPVPLLIDEPGRAETVLVDFSPLGLKLAKQFWPGKLTIVARGAPDYSQAVGSPDGTIGVRVPDSPVARSLAGLCNGIITGTSANKSGEYFPFTIFEVKKDFENEEVLILDGGDLPPSTGSTVVLIEGKILTVIREGDLKRKEILKIAEEYGNG